jgi:hypothetical protein
MGVRARIRDRVRISGRVRETAVWDNTSLTVATVLARGPAGPRAYAVVSSVTRFLPRLCPFFLALLAGGPAWAAAGAPRSITASSEEGQNVSRATDFLARMGDAEEAREVAGLLAEGKVQVFPPGEIEDTIPGELMVPEGDVRRPAGPDAGKPFDAYVDLAAIVRLASSLHHGRVHLHQAACFVVASRRRVENTPHGEVPHEIEARESTLLAMSRWVERARASYERERTPQALYELVVLLDGNRAALADFVVNDCFGAPGCVAWEELKETVQQEAYDGRTLLRAGTTPGPDDGERERLRAWERYHVRQLASAFVPSSAGLADRLCAEPLPESLPPTELLPQSRKGVAFDVGVGAGLGGAAWIPVQVDVGYRIPAGFQLGAQVTYGPLFDPTCQVGIPAESCRGNVLRVDLALKWVLVPRSRSGPWLGVSSGYEWARLSGTDDGNVASSNRRGLEFFTFQIGEDIRFANGWAVGPFLDVSFGDYSQSSATLWCNPGSYHPCPATTAAGYYGGEDAGGHFWLQAGIHGEYLLPLK